MIIVTIGVSIGILVLANYAIKQRERNIELEQKILKLELKLAIYKSKSENLQKEQSSSTIKFNGSFETQAKQKEHVEPSKPWPTSTRNETYFTPPDNTSTIVSSLVDSSSRSSSHCDTSSHSSYSDHSSSYDSGSSSCDSGSCGCD
jgi:hypothetical protein